MKTWARKLRVGMSLLCAVLIAALLVIGSNPGHRRLTPLAGGPADPPDTEAMNEEHAGSFGASTNWLRVDLHSAHDVTWTVVSYVSYFPNCYDARATRSSTGAPLGDVGGCISSGTNLDTNYLVGAVDSSVDGSSTRFSTVAFGVLSAQTAVLAKKVKVTWGDGATSSSTVENNAWLVIRGTPGYGTAQILDVLNRALVTFTVVIPQQPVK